MNPITTVLEGHAGRALRLNLAQAQKLNPAVVDQWLIDPYTDCGHQHQLVLGAWSLADLPGVTPVQGLLRRYSHQICLGQVIGGPCSAEEVLTSDALVSHPVVLGGDGAARQVARNLACDVVMGALPAFPTTDTQQSTWQLAVTMAVWRRECGLSTPQPLPAPLMRQGTVRLPDGGVWDGNREVHDRYPGREG